jgi:rare lipoprotein A
MTVSLSGSADRPDLDTPSLETITWRLSAIGQAVFILFMSLYLETATYAAALVSRVQYGVASWYGEPFHGRLTANGERYDMYQLTAAHQHAPLGIHAIVTHLQTGRTVRVRVTDRGPFIKNRLIDLSYGAARRLGMVEAGLAEVKIEFLPETIPSVYFIVQAGAYSSVANALSTQETLRAHYTNVQIMAPETSASPWFRVRLGPFETRPEAEQVAHHIRTLGYHTIVLPQS